MFAASALAQLTLSGLDDLCGSLPTQDILEQEKTELGEATGVSFSTFCSKAGCVNHGMGTCGTWIWKACEKRHKAVFVKQRRGVYLL